MARIVSYTPAYRGWVAVEHSQQRVREAVWAVEHQHRVVGHVTRGNVEAGRNDVLARAVRDDIEWVYMVDADCWADGLPLAQLLATAEHWAATITAAPVQLRTGSRYNCSPARAGEVYEVHWIGPAISLVHVPRLLALRLPQPWYRTGYTDDHCRVTIDEGCQLTMDVSARGGIVMADHTIKTRHLGEVVLGV